MGKSVYKVFIQGNPYITSSTAELNLVVTSVLNLVHIYLYLCTKFSRSNLGAAIMYKCTVRVRNKYH